MFSKFNLNRNKNSENGQTLIEILVAIGLTAVLLPALLTALITSREGTAQESQRLDAVALMREMTEAVRNVRERDWNLLVSGTYNPTISGSQWTLISGALTSGGYTKQVILSDVFRDSSGNIATTGTLDPSTKKASYTVAWTLPIAGSIQETEYLTRYISNTAITHTTQSDFDASGSVKTNTRSTSGGSIELTPATVSVNFTDDFLTSTDYTYDSAKIEVTGGYAQLKNQGTITTGTTTNQNFTSNSTGWTFTRFNTNVSQTGSYVSTGGNTGGYINLNFPASTSVIASGFWRQSFTTSLPTISATLSFDYRVLAYVATPDSFRIYAWIDTGTGTPTTTVWDSGSIAATSGWVTVSGINVASFIPSAGTYNLKLGATVDYPLILRGPYTVGFDNIDLDWTVGNLTYASDAPSIVEKNSFTLSNLTAWTSFAETSELNGGTIYYQLSDDDGTSWKYWTGSAWSTVSSDSNRNTASVINSNISTFPITNKKIRVKAFLSGNGSQQVRLDKVTIGYTGHGGNNSGTYTSATMDTGGTSGFNTISWTESNTSNTTTKFRVATNTDNSTWTYKGPDGTTGTYFTGGSGTLPLTMVLGRYLRYEITFTTTNSDNPSVSDVTINYSP